MSKDINKSSSLTGMTSEDLNNKLTTHKKELLSLRFKHKLGELTDTSLFSKAKKSIAQINTELNKRNKAGE